MNCINHPEVPAVAYCQQCGKALCSECVRSVANTVSCEPCLAAKLGMGGAGAPAPGTYTVNINDPNFQYSATGVMPPAGPPNYDAKPILAGILGFIPGVGAMYNGQFIKGLVHVLVFVILITLTEDHGMFGLFIGAWVFYQAFDAYQTAKARRDGLPLPDPFGLNELGTKLGLRPATVPVAGYPNAANYPNAAGQPGVPAAAAYDTSAYQAGYPAVPPMPPVPPIPPMPPRRSEPVGAIILIGLGVMFLLSSMGILSMHWLGHAWPILLIAIGAWLIFKRTRDVADGGVK
jgi:hypothetical protein